MYQAQAASVIISPSQGAYCRFQSIYIAMNSTVTLSALIDARFIRLVDDHVGSPPARSDTPRKTITGKRFGWETRGQELTVEVNERLDRPWPEVARGLERGVLSDIRHDKADGRAAPVCSVNLPPHPIHPRQRRQGLHGARQQEAEQHGQRRHLAPQAGELHGHGWRPSWQA